MNVQMKPELESAIRARAYQIWEDEGRPNGQHELHWQRAYEAIVSTVPAARAVTDDVSLIDGVGPKITKQLAEVGITTLSQIAAMSHEALADLDAKLALKGRTAREDWMAQAQDLVAGRPPRAKIDQAKVAAKKN
jgi:predicted flap endonuclease-1-like 5' DNA nuclease